jgi:hypothetical protein
MKPAGRSPDGPQDSPEVSSRVHSTLDPWHSALIDAVCAQDARRVAAGEGRFTRLAVDHEFCTPVGCVASPTLVHVIGVAPGHRMRWPLWLPEVSE